MNDPICTRCNEPKSYHDSGNEYACQASGRLRFQEAPEVTDAMIEAGLGEWWNSPHRDMREEVTAIYLAMRTLEQDGK